MIRIYKGDEKLLVTISGDNFSDLQKVCKQNGGVFSRVSTTEDNEPVMNAWEFDFIVGKDLTKGLLAVEDFNVPDYAQLDTGEKDPEFVRVRACIDPRLVKSDFEGDYQRKAVLKGITQNRLALFHDMGLGKSFSVITIMNHLIAWGKIDKIVVISPPEGIMNLQREFLRFNSFGLEKDDICIVDTENRNPFLGETKKVTILSYRNLIMLHDDFYKAKRKKKANSKIYMNYIPWDTLGTSRAIILDESPEIKNRNSKTFKIVDKFKKFFYYRYILTGTPAPKYAEDLWTQFRFLQETCVPTKFETFINMIANVGNQYSSLAVNYYYESKVAEFLDRVSYLVDRVKTEGNKELPDLIVKPILCKMSKEQSELYKDLIKKVIMIIREVDGKVTRRALQNKFSYLVLALHDPCVMKEGSLDLTFTDQTIVKNLRKWKITDNGKFNIAKSIINKNVQEGKKTILWSGHPAIIDRLYEEFSDKKPFKLHAGVVVNKGESVAERNDSIVESFKNTKDSWLLIANYMCLKTSANITQAPRQIFWDRNWDAETFAQACKRSHRIGQKERVIINPLMFCDSIEIDQHDELERRLRFNSKVWATPIKEEEDTLLDEPLTLDDCKKILLGI
ncbi:MAG: SNF2-related protein [Bacteroidales bacterium]